MPKLPYEILTFFNKQAWNTFSLKSASQVFQYISFTIITIKKLPKAQVTKGIQSSSHPRYTKSKSPKVYKVQVSQSAKSTSLSKSKSPKAQVSQSPSYPRCPKSKLPKVSKVQVTQGVQSPSCQNCSKSKLPKVQITQSPSWLKSKLPQSKPVKNSYGTPILKGIHGPIMVQNIYFQPLNLSIYTINL